MKKFEKVEEFDLAAFVKAQKERQALLMKRYNKLVIPYGISSIPDKVSVKASGLMDEWMAIRDRLWSGYGVETMGVSPKSDLVQMVKVDRQGYDGREAGVFLIPEQDRCE